MAKAVIECLDTIEKLEVRIAGQSKALQETQAATAKWKERAAANQAVLNWWKRGFIEKAWGPKALPARTHEQQNDAVRLPLGIAQNSGKPRGVEMHSHAEEFAEGGR
jgi:uncharacterized coiled-coil protein SlyX